MKERILIGFKRNGKEVRVTNLDPDPEDGGVVLSEETSALPRGFGIELTPANAVTKERVWRVQQQRGWLGTGGLRLKVTQLGPRLHLEGIDEKALPRGKYDLEFRLSGVPFKKPERRNVTIPPDGALQLTFEETPLKHRFQLNTAVNKFDTDTKSILDASRFDGKRAGPWLSPNVLHRDLRKACLMNILAKLAVVPARREPLNKYVRNIFVVEQDRIYAEVGPKFFRDVKKTFLPKDLTIHSTHERLLRKIPGSPGDYKLQSHREDKGSGSLQVIGAVPKTGAAPRDVRYVDVDIDEANPGYDLLRFILHVGHLFRSGKTNHLKLRSKIVGQTSDFLYYNAVPV